ncbi:MAG: hypothetical protein U1A77_18785 [Pirellulales bacterium]
MLYLGIGNAGTQILDHLRTQAIDVSHLEDAAWGNARLAVGDADTNNSVIFKYDPQREGRGLFKQDAPSGVCKVPLDQFWSGGCGVYHLIGQLISEEVDQRNGITGVLNAWVHAEARKAVSVFLSAGGGTGGGAGRSIATILANKWSPNSTRMYTVFPAIDQFSTPHDASPQDRVSITCEDSFQCVSAGRFLVKYLADRINDRGGTVDLYIFSGGYLAAPPERLSYSRALQRFDQFISRIAMILEDSFSAKGDVVVPAVGNANWVEAGDQRQWNAQLIARRLVQSALLPLDLAREEPTGIASLPLEKSKYESEIRQFQSQLANGSLPRQCDSVEALRQVKMVEARLYYNREASKHQDTDVTSVLDATRDILRTVFGDRVTVSCNAVTGISPRRMSRDSEFTLLLLLVSPLVDDVYRLVTYYVQSSFEWQNGRIQDVAELINRALVEPIPNRVALQQMIRNGYGGVALGPNEKEVFSPHFWGNYHSLRGKVLQALRRPRSAIDGSLLSSDDVADALWYLRAQLWRRSTATAPIDI